MAEKLQKPVEPTPNECCGGGSCCPCVWDAYYEQLRLWQIQEGIEPTATVKKNPEPVEPDYFYR